MEKGNCDSKAAELEMFAAMSAVYLDINYADLLSAMSRIWRTNIGWNNERGQGVQYQFIRKETHNETLGGKKNKTKTQQIEEHIFQLL